MDGAIVLTSRLSLRGFQANVGVVPERAAAETQSEKF